MMVNNIYKQLKEIEKKWGIEAWNEILYFFGTLHDKIKDLEKSRDNWRKKYENLKNNLVQWKEISS